MPKFAANISMMYAEVPFLERFAAAARDGFTAVEFQFAYEHPPAAIRAKLDEANVQLVLLNAPPGNVAQGDRGLGAQPGREVEFRTSLSKGIEYARALACPRIHVMAGLAKADADRSLMRRTFLDNLRFAAREAAPHGITICIEPLNTRDNPGYFLNFQSHGAKIVAEVGAPNVKLQFDFYHRQIMEGDIAMGVRAHFNAIGHIQIAGVPGRHEPDNGEINHPYLFALLDELGYDGWIGAEYRPIAGTSAGLGWLRPWLSSR